MDMSNLRYLIELRAKPSGRFVVNLRRRPYGVYRYSEPMIRERIARCATLWGARRAIARDKRDTPWRGKLIARDL